MIQRALQCPCYKATPHFGTIFNDSIRYHIVVNSLAHLFQTTIIMGFFLIQKLILAISMSILLTVDVAFAANVRCSTIFSDQSVSNFSPQEVAEIIKNYIFQGPILNFYLRYRYEPSQAVIAKALFTANDLDASKADNLIENIDKVLRTSPARNESIFVYRGESRVNDGTIKIGARLHYKNFISTTRNIDLAKGYARGNASTSNLQILYRVQVDPGMPGLQINELAPAGIRNQDEFLLARNGLLIVTDIQTDGDLILVNATYALDID